MATKNNPGAFKCYEAALPDEEFFTALARDLAAPATVDFWCDERERLGLVKTEDDRNRINEARRVAQQMRMWRAKAILDATANNEEPIWRQPRQIMDDGPPVCMGAMRDPITVKGVLTRLLDTTLDGLHHGVLGEVVSQIQAALTAIDRDMETVATPFEVSGAIQPHDYYIIGERSPLSYDALCVRLDRFDAIRLAAKKVHEINADLKEFDGDRRGIAAASVEAVEDMVKVVMEMCPDEGEYPTDLKSPLPTATGKAEGPFYASMLVQDDENPDDDEFAIVSNVHHGVVLCIREGMVVGATRQAAFEQARWIAGLMNDGLYKGNTSRSNGKEPYTMEGLAERDIRVTETDGFRLWRDEEGALWFSQMDNAEPIMWSDAYKVNKSLQHDIINVLLNRVERDRIVMQARDTVPVMTGGLILVHGRAMDIREIENALAEEKLDEYRKRYPTPDYIWPGTELKPTLDTAPEDLAHAPEVPPHRFSTFVKHGRYAYARGLEIAPMHLPRALEAMANDGWHLVSLFGATDSQNVGFIFKRGPATFDIPPMGDRDELMRRVREECAKLGESYEPSGIDLGRQQEP